MPLKWLLCLTGAFFLGILYIGLTPKDIFLANHVHWLSDPAGIHFDEYALAYTAPLPRSFVTEISQPRGFSIELALKPDSFRGRFRLIALFYDGDDREQLLIGQWRSSIIVMNGDDYDYKRKIKRLSVKTSFEAPRFITVTSNKAGTYIYVDGHLAKKRRELVLKIPKKNAARLVLANSVYGRNSYKGDIHGLAIYGRSLGAKEIATHFKEWSKDHHFAYASSHQPLALYCFDEQKGETAADHGSFSCHLNVPLRMKVLRPELFFQRFSEPRFDGGFIKDTLVNFLGFLAFGLVLAAFFIRRGGVFKIQCVLFCLIAGFSLSLFIETAQAWMPTRSSDLLDLILNTIGAMVGATICQAIAGSKSNEGHTR